MERKKIARVIARLRHQRWGSMQEWCRGFISGYEIGLEADTSVPTHLQVKRILDTYFMSR